MRSPHARTFLTPPPLIKKSSEVIPHPTPTASCHASLAVHHYPFIPLGGERHWENKVSRPGAQHNFQPSSSPGLRVHTLLPLSLLGCFGCQKYFLPLIQCLSVVVPTRRTLFDVLKDENNFTERFEKRKHRLSSGEKDNFSNRSVPKENTLRELHQETTSK